MNLEKVSIVGLGYVGLPLAVEFAKAGLTVFGIEQNPVKVERVNRGESYIEDIDSKELFSVVSSGRLKAFTEFSPIKDSDAIVICVPTPLTIHKEPDISYIVNVTNEIAKFLKERQLIVLESTTYPGTTEEVVLPILEKSGLRAGKDFYLAFSPERVDPGNKRFSMKDIPKVVGGINKESTEFASKLYSYITDKVYPVSSPRVAEMEKLLENIFRLVNISFVNELALLCQRMDIDIWEVIEAASTKPYGFMPFYPGPGLGGHCIIGQEMILIKNSNMSNVFTLEEIFEIESKRNILYKKDDIEYIKPKDLFINSIGYDLKAEWKPVTHIFRRIYRGKIVKITTNDNRSLIVTERHPMLVIQNNSLKIVEAKDLKVGDILPLFMENSESPPISKDITIDLVKELPKNWDDKVRVRLRDGLWKDYRKDIYSICSDNRKYEYIRKNFIPLGLLRKLEREKNFYIDHKNLILLTGRGQSFRQFPGVINIDKDLARFIGYYLSEGCASSSDGYWRIRLTINRDETSLYKDIISTISKLNLTYSEYLSPQFKSKTIRINSPLFGWLLIERLNCGRNSYTMRIPDELMFTSRELKKELLIGLFRGDGDVYFRSGKKMYTKNNRLYNHNDNSLTVGYFSVSKTLFIQVLYLLQENGIYPAIKKGKNRLLINGYDQLAKLSDWFIDEKGRKYEKYFNSSLKMINKRKYSQVPSAIVKNIEYELADNIPVYSVEVKDNNTFAVGSGIYVHNCIPIDPFYLSWKAKEYDFDVRFIELAGEINDSMPYYIVDMVMKALNTHKKALNGSKVLVIGIAYKPNVADPRESPALKIIPELEKLGAKIEYHDPYINEIKIGNKIHSSTVLTEEIVRSSDCVLIVTDHDNIDYNLLYSNAQLIVDTRNALRKRGIEINERVVRL